MAFFLAGCGGGVGPTGKVSVFNAGIEVASVDVYLDGTLFKGAVAYGGGAAATPVARGTHAVKITPAGDSGTVLAEGSIDVAGDKNYVVGLQGVSPDQGGNADTPPLAVGSAELGAGINFYNAVPNGSSYSLYLSVNEPAQPFVTAEGDPVAFGSSFALPADAARPLLRVREVIGGIEATIIYRAVLSTTEGAFVFYPDKAALDAATPSVSPAALLLPNSGEPEAVTSTPTDAEQPTLKKVDLPIVSNADCQNQIGSGSPLGLDLTDNMFCAGSPSQDVVEDTCQGDSGGPVTTVAEDGTPVQVGVVSFGLGCAQPNRAGAYTKINNYLDLISQATGISTTDLTTNSTQLRPQIVGGENTDISAFPWQVNMQLVLEGQPKPIGACGGSVISPDWVITAAHCVIFPDGKGGEAQIQPSAYQVLLGTTNNSDGSGTSIKVSEIIVPPSYHKGPKGMQSQDGDFALIHLATPTTQTPIRLAGADEATLYEAGRIVTIAGWGSILER